jgi:prevent-host-death family protein
MHTIGVFEAKTKLAALLDEVEAGGAVTITRRGKAVARLIPVPAVPDFDREKARLAAEGLKALSKGLTLGDLTIKDLISEGRR